MSRRQPPRRGARSAALLAALGLLVAGHGASAATGSAGALELNTRHSMPMRGQGPKNIPNGRALGLGSIFGINGIRYHGGPIMLGTTNAYAIFYGGWTGSPTPA